LRGVAHLVKFDQTRALMSLAGGCNASDIKHQALCDILCETPGGRLGDLSHWEHFDFRSLVNVAGG